MERKRPRIEDLNKFVRFYFKKNTPIVKYKKMKYCRGEAYLKERIIYLNTTHVPYDGGVEVTQYGYYGCYNGDVEIKDLTKQEQYYLVLLHEIGHFIIKLKIPQNWRLIKKELQKKYPKDLHEQYHSAACYFIPENKDVEKYADRLEIDIGGSGASYPRLGKKSEEIYGKCLEETINFQSWLMGGNRKEHVMVEDWARKEFLKHRTVINEVIKKKSYTNRSMGIGGFFKWKVVNGKRVLY